MFTEIETKYNADSITLEAFDKICAALGGKIKTVASYDHYYTPKKRCKFIRYRQGQNPELTMKEKMAIGNNYRRVECNLPISPTAAPGVVAKFCSMLGFHLNFSIFKESTIYWFDKFNTVYYVVYTDETHSVELGRFIEIEMDEHHSWESEEQAWDLLLETERKLAAIGIKPRRRLKKSLFELYRK